MDEPESSVLIEEIALRGFLSFAPDAEPVKLRSLNLLIGPNGSGKSNFLDAFDVLQAAPTEIGSPIERGGGWGAWVWKDEHGVAAKALSIEAVVRIDAPVPVRYQVTLAPGWVDFLGAHDERIEDARHWMGLLGVHDERIEDAKPREGRKKPSFHYGTERGKRRIQRKGEEEPRAIVRPEGVHPSRSILAERRGRDIYPEIFQLVARFEEMRVYRSWSFGRDAPGRHAVPTYQATGTLAPHGDNLALVLGRLLDIPRVKREIQERLRRLYAPLDDVHVEIAGEKAEIFLREGDRLVPGARLSDGTLRYLSLLAILCDPEPPPLVILEQPELGLHPDVLPTIADLLVAAAERTQLVVTTHSGVLIDAFTELPEHVLVCERDERGSHLRRLDGERLAAWLKEHSLGALWSRGDIGGNRW